MLKRLSVFALSAVLAFGAVGAQAAEKKSPYWQCVTFARSITGMNIFGDAWTWWDGASGKYDKGQAPKAGAVLVFRPQGKMRLGHVAVVSQVVTERVIQITHANWSPIGGRRGQVEKDVTVVDVSDKGDWSKVKVWYGPIADVGTTVYPTYGFIYQAAQKGQEMGENLVTQVLDKPTVKKPSSFDKVAQKTSSKTSNKALATALTSGAVDAEAPRSQTLASAAADEAVAPKAEAKAETKPTEKAKATADKASDKKAADKKVAAKKPAEKATKVADAKSKSAKSEKASSKKAVAEADEKPAAKPAAKGAKAEKTEKSSAKKVAETESKKTEKKKA